MVEGNLISVDHKKKKPVKIAHSAPLQNGVEIALSKSQIKLDRGPISILLKFWTLLL